MRKKTIQYDSFIDALVAVSKRLSVYENRYAMESEDFFNKYNNGQTSDDSDFIKWANDYQHYLAIRLEIGKYIQNVA